MTKRTELNEALRRVNTVLREFDEKDAVALEVYYRVSPRFINDVRLITERMNHLATMAAARRVMAEHAPALKWLGDK